MIKNKLIDFNDLLIEPEIFTDINSRNEIYFYYNDNLPLMTAPMDTVIDENNKSMFIENKIVPVLPRIKSPNKNYISTDGTFYSYSLDDFENIFINQTLYIKNNVFALIDIANGHMTKLYNLTKLAKEKYGDKLVLMVGNVANPITFRKYCDIKVDYVRIGIGNGGGCLTTKNTGVGYSMASLINSCYEIKTYSNYKTKIVADGGFKEYSDIIKALGLGADYVMLGSIFNKCLESCGVTTYNGEIINQYSEDAVKMFNSDIPLYKKFRGRRTKEVQIEWGKDKITTSEGVIRTNLVEYTLNGWVENFSDYLKSAMSYTNKKTLPEFIGNVNFNIISENSYKRFNK